MNVCEQELLELSIARLAHRSRNDTVGVLISSMKHEAKQIDPDDFRVFMASEFELNQMVFCKEDMKIGSTHSFDALTSLSPVILLKGQPEFLFQIAADSGLRFVSAAMGDDYFGNVSTIWSTSSVVAVPLRNKEELFMNKVFTLARTYAILNDCKIHIGITSGWGMDSYIGDLEKFNENEISAAGRLIWQRTPLG